MWTQDLLSGHAHAIIRRPRAMFRIEITLPSGETQEHTFRQTELSIGRMLGQVQLQDPGVSALHGQLTLEDGDVCYRDLGSAQGSFLPDGTPIRYTVSMKCGDRVRLGDHQLALIEFVDPEAPAPSAPPKNEAVVIQADSKAPPKRPTIASAHAARRRRARAQRPVPASSPPPEAPPTAATPTKTPVAPPQNSTAGPVSAPVPPPEPRAAARSARTEQSTKPLPTPAAPAKEASSPILGELSPTPIQFTGRERSAPRITPSEWVDAAQDGLLVNQSRALLRAHRSRLFGSGPILIAAMGWGFVLALGLTAQQPAFFVLLFLVFFALGVHASTVFGLSVIDLLSDQQMRPLQSWKRAGKIPFIRRMRLLLAMLGCAPLLGLPLFVLPVGLLEQQSPIGLIRRSTKVLRSNLRSCLGPLLRFGCCVLAAFAWLVVMPYALAEQLPYFAVRAIAVAGAMLFVLLAVLSGMVASVHAIRVYVWQCGRENSQAPQLRPALILPTDN